MPMTLPGSWRALEVVKLTKDKCKKAENDVEPFLHDIVQFCVTYNYIYMYLWMLPLKTHGRSCCMYRSYIECFNGKRFNYSRKNHFLSEPNLKQFHLLIIQTKLK